MTAQRTAIQAFGLFRLSYSSSGFGFLSVSYKFAYAEPYASKCFYCHYQNRDEAEDERTDYHKPHFQHENKDIAHIKLSVCLAATVSIDILHNVVWQEIHEQACAKENSRDFETDSANPRQDFVAAACGGELVPARITGPDVERYEHCKEYHEVA